MTQTKVEKMEMVFVGDMEFETNAVESIDFVKMVDDGAKEGEKHIHKHDAYVVPSKYSGEMKSDNEWYCKDTCGGFVIFDCGLNLIAGYSEDDFDDMMNDYPTAKPMNDIDDCFFDWGEYTKEQGDCGEC